MPDKKPTDSEIVKALEYCAEPVGINCCKCPLEKDCLEVNMCELALDLINRQKAEVSELQHRNSELEIELKSMRGAANSYKAEVERLKDTLNATIAGQETFQRYIATAKAEAVKEFAERLKAEMLKSKYNITTSSYSRACNAVIDFWVEEIDNLLKELVGEQNG